MIKEILSKLAILGNQDKPPRGEIELFFSPEVSTNIEKAQQADELAHFFISHGVPKSRALVLRAHEMQHAVTCNKVTSKLVPVAFEGEIEILKDSVHIGSSASVEISTPYDDLEFSLEQLFNIALAPEEPSETDVILARDIISLGFDPIKAGMNGEVLKRKFGVVKK